MQHTDLPIPLRAFYDGMGALSAMYEEDIYRTKYGVAGDEIGATWTSAIGESALRRALAGTSGSSWHGLGKFKKFQTN